MQIVNRYNVQGELGKGAMGTVYQVYDRLTQRSVALKKLNTLPARSEEDPATDETLVSLAREFQILARLHHPHIIPVLDYGFDKDGHPFFTMQLLDSPQNFADVAKQASLVELVTFFIHILQALTYLHQHGIIHRDLKPANILIQNQHAYVLDFGLSQVTDVAIGRAGTVAYMSPEVMRRARATKKSDLFAVGVMLYEIITGEYPYTMQALLGIIPFVRPREALVDHPLERVISRLLSENPSDRYDSAHLVIQALCQAVGIEAPAEDPIIRDSYLLAAPFVGREAELKMLEDALQTAQHKQGSVWFIGGESGVGKSRLMDEIRISALTGDFLVVRGQGSEEGNQPYQVWRHPLRRIILSVELDDFDVSVLQEIIPDIDDLLKRDVKRIPKLSGAAHQQRLIGTIVAVIKQTQQPILLILEDLQWAIESLEPLKILNQEIRQYPIVVLGTYRDDERRNLPTEIPNTHALKLSRLSETDIAVLSQSMIGQAGTQPEVLEFLQHETEGNAFFLVEIVRALAEGAGSLRSIGQATLPKAIFSGGIQSVIQRRLDKVPNLYHLLLELAAVAGRRIDQQILEYIVNHDDGFSDTHFKIFLNKCADAAVFEMVYGEWQFSHDKLREYILSGLSEAKTANFHQQVAAAIEAVYADDLISYATKLSYHWRFGKNYQKELSYLRIAGQRATDTSSYNEAIEVFERALVLVSDTDQLALEANILINMGDNLSRLGKNERANQVLQQGLELAKEINSDEIYSEALNLLGCIKRDQGMFEDASALFKEGLTLARQVKNQELIAAILLELGWLDHRLALYEKAYQHFSESVTIYETMGHSRGLAIAYNRLGGAALKLRDYDTSTTLRQKSIAISREIGDRWSEATALANLGEIARLQENYTVAQQYYLDALEIERRINAPQLTAIVLTNLASIEFIAKDYDVAMNYYLKSLKDAYTTQSISIILHNLVGIAHIWVRLQQKGRAINLLQLVIYHPALMGESKKNATAILEELGLSPMLNISHEDHPDLETIVQALLEESAVN